MRHARGERGMIGLAAAVASVVIVAVIGGALLVHGSQSYPQGQHRILG